VGQVALQPDYFAYPLIPGMFVALAGTAATWQHHELSSPADLLFSCAVAGIAIISLGAHFFLPVGFVQQLVGSSSIVLTICVAFFGAALFPLAKSLASRLLFAVAAFSVANVIGASQPHIFGSTATDHYAYDGSPCIESKRHFVALIESNRFLTSFDPTLASTYAWWDNDEVLKDSDGCAFNLRAFGASMSSFNNGLFLASPYPLLPTAEDLPESSVSLMTLRRRIALPTANSKAIDRLI